MSDNLPPMAFKDRCTVAVESLPNAPYRTMLASLLDEMLAAIEKDRERQSVPSGYVLVPIEPSDEMWAAVNKVDDNAFAGGSMHGADFESLWNAAIAAAIKKHGGT